MNKIQIFQKVSAPKFRNIKFQHLLSALCKTEFVRFVNIPGWYTLKIQKILVICNFIA
jgi:hypothetical protein